MWELSGHRVWLCSKFTPKTWSKLYPCQPWAGGESKCFTFTSAAHESWWCGVGVQRGILIAYCSCITFENQFWFISSSKPLFYNSSKPCFRNWLHFTVGKWVHWHSITFKNKSARRNNFPEGANTDIVLGPSASSTTAPQMTNFMTSDDPQPVVDWQWEWREWS